MAILCVYSSNNLYMCSGMLVNQVLNFVVQRKHVRGKHCLLPAGLTDQLCPMESHGGNANPSIPGGVCCDGVKSGGRRKLCEGRKRPPPMPTHTESLSLLTTGQCAQLPQTDAALFSCSTSKLKFKTSPSRKRGSARRINVVFQSLLGFKAEYKSFSGNFIQYNGWLHFAKYLISFNLSLQMDMVLVLFFFTMYVNICKFKFTCFFQMSAHILHSYILQSCGRPSR